MIMCVKPKNIGAWYNFCKQHDPERTKILETTQEPKYENEKAF